MVNHLKPSLKIKVEKSYHSNFAMLCVFCAPIMLWVRGEEIREATYIYGGVLLSGECLSFWSLYRLDAQQGKGEGGGGRVGVYSLLPETFNLFMTKNL